MQQARTVSRMNVVDSVEEKERRRGVGRREGWVVDVDGGRKKKKRAGERGGEHSIYEYFDLPARRNCVAGVPAPLHSGKHNQ